MSNSTLTWVAPSRPVVGGLVAGVAGGVVAAVLFAAHLRSRAVEHGTTRFDLFDLMGLVVFVAAPQLLAGALVGVTAGGVGRLIGATGRRVPLLLAGLAAGACGGVALVWAHGVVAEPRHVAGRDLLATAASGVGGGAVGVGLAGLSAAAVTRRRAPNPPARA
ncbi:MAG TPA: hypothetical protein VM597_01945 [Gemmataceae bacterium]|nr:hypothetical protein [Gemmataceae bacterium]